MSTTKRNIAPPDSITRTVIRARDDHLHESKRYDGLKSGAKTLDENRDLLEDQTVAKNREFKRRVDALMTRNKRVLEKQEIETDEREREYTEFKAAFLDALNDLRHDFESKLNQSFTELKESKLKPLEASTRELKENINHFMEVTVPSVIETQSGEVVRYMKRERQTFEFDNTKIMQREVKIVSRAADHEKITQQSFESESSTCHASFQRLREEISIHSRLEDRSDEQLHNKVLPAIHEIQEDLSLEKEIRCNQDITLMSGLETSLSHIQSVIIKNFGTDKIR